ncbi:MAG: acetate--CoA ligase family protein [candidate division Zixibacteria bacterium]|nr:acetate--CoA ligase family protein [candidate division Zixibacteria bacterium]MDH3938459.1 acetate--CoA ligase family protein [candidate division Zixibacteria bacterium]MDH4033731.1 acetate--CoA ligase family protein [candidate division Zixibacteria bacterium]
MRLYEFEGKELFERFRIPVGERHIARTPDEVYEIVSDLKYPVVIKSQVLTGGRGKAGGIKTADGANEARTNAEQCFNLTIKDFPVELVLIEPRLDITQEFYIGVTLDRANYKIVVIASGEGGVDIEETAATHPEKIVRKSLSIEEELFTFDALTIAKKIGIPASLLKEGAAIIVGLYNLFRRYDAKLVEINPLVLTADGKLMAADARVSLDDDAVFRHPDLVDLGIEKRHEEGEMTPREQQATEWGIPYLDLDGNIGMFPGGAGFGIMGNDFIHYYGGRPANFMDSGGGPSPERIAKMLVLLDENPNVKVIFGARFGGISRCDDFAKGVLMFLNDHGLSKPMVMRMTGNMWQEGVRIFEEAKQKNPELFSNVEAHGIETPIEEISKRAVELANLEGGN